MKPETIKQKFTEPILIKAGSNLLKLGLTSQPPKVDCRVISEGNYQLLKKSHYLMPELLEAIQKAIAISDLWTFDKDVTIEHEDEARALHSMKLEFDRLIKEAT